MPLEEGGIDWLIGGFSIVTRLVLLILLLLLFKNKTSRSAYVWTIFHLLLLSVAFYFSIKAISFDYKHEMASEEYPLLLGIAGIIWAFSMVCLLIGIFKFSKPRKYSAS